MVPLWPRTDGPAAIVVMAAALLQLTSVTSAASADLTPDSLTVGLSEKTHDFLCAVTGASRADVLIDNTAFEDQSIKDRGIIVTSITIDRAAGIFNSTISIPASIDNNNTDIVCFSVNFSSPGLPPRSEARFFVQGLLEAPMTELVSVNESYLSFQWRAPFTLDITDVELDIQFYSFHESLTDSSVNMTDVGEYVFPNVAVAADFTVSAWNIVGEGERAITTHQPCSITEEQQTVNVDEVRSEVLYSEDMTTSLSFTVDWPTACIPLFSVELAEEGGEGERVTHDRLVPHVIGSNEDRQLHLLLPLQGPDNSRYMAQLSSISDQRTVTADDTLSYSTHDVQAVVIDFTPNSITTNCQFATGSLALGCSVHISNETEAEVEVHKVMRDANGQGLPLSVEVTVEGLESGVYTVTVYDIESDGEASTDGAPAHTQTIDISEPTTQPTTSDTSTTPDIGVTGPLSPSEEEPQSSSNTVPIIAGAIVGGVLLIAGTALVIIMGLVYVRRTHRKAVEETDGREREFVFIGSETGPAASSESVSAHLSSAHTVQASTNSSPSHTLPGSKLSLQPRKNSLPPAYSELESSKYNHMRSMSDDIVNSGSVAAEARTGRGTKAAKMTHPQADSQSTHGNATRTVSLKKALEATLSSPATSPPPPITTTLHSQPIFPSSTISSHHTGHTHLHQCSSSLGGHQSPSHKPTSQLSISTRPPPHPPKNSSSKRTRAPPPPSLSTPALLCPPPSSTPPPPVPTLISEDILSLPSGRRNLGPETTASSDGFNPLYDRAVALQQTTAGEKKRWSIHYSELAQSTAPPPSTSDAGLLALPQDKEVVMYSELNIGELAPRLPNKRSHVAPATSFTLEEASSRVV